MFYFHWEFPFLDALQSLHNPLLDSFMTAVTSLGNAGIFWILTGILLLFFKKTRKCGVTVLLALLFSLLAGNFLLKNLAARQRPCWINQDVPLLIKMPADFSFPSGHTQAGFAAALSIFFYFRKAGIAALLLAALIGFSRLYLYVHFPTDVLGGLVIGCVLAALAYLLVKKASEKKAAGHDT